MSEFRITLGEMLDEKSVSHLRDELAKTELKKIASNVQTMVERSKYYEEDINRESLLQVVYDIEKILPILD